jgi:hypothetical protein
MGKHSRAFQILRESLLVALVVLLPGYGVLLLAVNDAMHKSPEQFGRFMSHMPGIIFLFAPFETFWTHARAGNLKLGDAAPDFTLPTLDKTSQVTLESFRNKKPVVLVFGSYT